MRAGCAAGSGDGVDVLSVAVFVAQKWRVLPEDRNYVGVFL